jgi:glycosyltransferase involved in cell wall biosynthesis
MPGAGAANVFRERNGNPVTSQPQRPGEGRRPIRVLYLIRSLGAGGAERQLVTLVGRLDRRRFAPAVALFYDEGELREDLARAGDVPVFNLAKRGRWDLPGFMRRVREAIGRFEPHVLHCYLTEANVFGRLAAWGGRAPRLVFGVRSSKMANPDGDLAVMVSQRLGRGLAGMADLVIYNSQTARDEAGGGWWPVRRGMVIPNGIDTDRYRPDDEGRRRVRAELGLNDTDLVIGQVARFNPKKDWPNFFRAAGRLAAVRPEVRFVGIGSGIDLENDEVRSLVQAAGLGDRVRLLGRRLDVERLMPALDLITLSSAYGEGFPNVVGEAMACGLPGVVTAVGDAPRIVGELGLVVPPRSSADLAAAWQALIGQPAHVRRKIGLAGRGRIRDRFSVADMVRRTEAAYVGLVDRRPRSTVDPQ